MTPQHAINLPILGLMNVPSLLEEQRFPAATMDALRAQVSQTSGLKASMRGTANGQPVLLGGTDPRRQGVVMGD